MWRDAVCDRTPRRLGNAPESLFAAHKFGGQRLPRKLGTGNLMGSRCPLNFFVLDGCFRQEIQGAAAAL